MASAMTKFYSYIEALHKGKHNWGSDTFKFMLTNTLPVVTNTQKSDITEIAGGNGYTAGGHTFNITSAVQALGIFKLVGDDIVITASGSIGPFRYVVLYNDTVSGDLLVGFYDAGSAITLIAGQTFTIDASQVSGLFTAQ